MSRFEFSNFYPCEIEYQGLIFPTPENLFQALKAKNPEFRKEFCNISPGDAKRMGRVLALREDWDEYRIPTMTYVQTRRFENIYWADKLMATGTEELVEYNTWHDNFWGVCTCPKCEGKGQNNLGKIIMGVRLTLLTKSMLY